MTHELLGRDVVLAEMNDLLHSGRSVLLFGPPEVGKTALIRACSVRGVSILDPFEGVNTHLAGEIRHAMDRGVVYLAATPSRDPAYLGAVRRIVFRFATVRVPPLGGHWMRCLITRECRRTELPADAVAPRWTRSVLRLSRGRPSVALEMVRVAADVWAEKRTLPSPATAYVEARVRLFVSSASGNAWYRQRHP